MKLGVCACKKAFLCVKVCVCVCLCILEGEISVCVSLCILEGRNPVYVCLCILEGWKFCVVCKGLQAKKGGQNVNNKKGVQIVLRVNFRENILL